MRGWARIAVCLLAGPVDAMARRTGPSRWLLRAVVVVTLRDTRGWRRSLDLPSLEVGHAGLGGAATSMGFRKLEILLPIDLLSGAFGRSRHPAW